MGQRSMLIEKYFSKANDWRRNKWHGLFRTIVDGIP